MAVKKGFLSFYSVCMFVCVYMCVCVFVCLLALYRRHRLTQEDEILTQIPKCEYLKMVSFTFLNFCLFLELFPFFHFLLFSLFQSFQSTYHQGSAQQSESFSVDIKYLHHQSCCHNHNQVSWNCFQPPMLNDDVCTAPTDKQTHKYIQNIHTE